jgi:DNA-binding transcriptional LysR family regulator
MAIELSELRSFVVLADHLHFGQAAEALHVSQPALTKQIQRLEDKVTGPLLIRGYRRVSLTPAGEILRDRARTLLRDAEIAEQMTRLAVNGKAGLLRIGFGIASLAAGLPEILARFLQHFPEVQVTMRDMSTPGQIEALERGDIDVGFVRLPVERPDLVTLPVLEEMLVAAVPRGMSYRKGLSSLETSPLSSSPEVFQPAFSIISCRLAELPASVLVSLRRSMNCSLSSISCKRAWVSAWCQAQPA